MMYLMLMLTIYNDLFLMTMWSFLLKKMFFFVLLMRMVNEIGGQERNYLAEFNFRNYARRQALELEFEYTEHIE